jgi:hypothetical protein
VRSPGFQAFAFSNASTCTALRSGGILFFIHIYSTFKGYYEMYVKLESNNIWVGLYSC